MRDLYPYTKFYLRDIKTRFGEYWKNHFSTIGIVGMNEACTNLLGEEEGTYTEKGRVFAAKVMDFMRAELTEFQKRDREQLQPGGNAGGEHGLQAGEEGQGAATRT